MKHSENIRHRVIDSLHSQPPESAARGAFEVINALQTLGSPTSQLIALACAYRNVCEVLGIDPMEAQRIVVRMEQDCRYRLVNTLSAVRAYTERELLPHFP